jgi:hypothetical protein
VGLLEQCWSVLQKVPPSFAQRKWVGDAMGVLARRILSLLVGSLPMTVRSLFDSVVSQWHRQQQDMQAPHSPLRTRHNYDAISPLSGLDDDITVSTSADADYPQRAHAQAKLWEQTCDAVLRALLQSSPTRYFETTMQGIRESAVSGDGESILLCVLCVDMTLVTVVGRVECEAVVTCLPSPTQLNFSESFVDPCRQRQRQRDVALRVGRHAAAHQLRRAGRRDQQAGAPDVRRLRAHLCASVRRPVPGPK